MDLIALKAEIQNDPLARGYAGMSHEQIAARLNVQDRTANRETLDTGLLAASIVRSELAAATAADRQYVQTIIAAQSLPMTATLKTELGAIFPVGSQTRANLLALLKRTGSRAEELGLGTVTTSNVADALRS